MRGLVITSAVVSLALGLTLLCYVLAMRTPYLGLGARVGILEVATFFAYVAAIGFLALLVVVLRLLVNARKYWRLGRA